MQENLLHHYILKTNLNEIRDKAHIADKKEKGAAKIFKSLMRILATNPPNQKARWESVTRSKD